MRAAPSTARLHGVVLAAGSGRRMGGPKALLRLGGRTLLERHLERLHEAGCADLLAVVRPADADAASAVARELGCAVEIVAAATPSQAASLVAALRRVALAADDVVAITPVDLLPPRVDTVRALAARLEGPFASSERVLAATPSFRGEGGHPALVRAAALAPYLRGETPPLREVLAALGPRRARLEVDDPSVTGDLDEPADLVAGAGRAGRRPRAPAPRAPR
ncbi:MAG: NTP transferase domain-containing protein [Labilithrix sp.]|nr:NTP transferase domain-containing protein [Labilithrix sp.]